MRLLLKIVAIYLAGIWLPATACCSLEAAGIDVFCAAAGGCDEGHGDDSTQVACNQIEAGKYHPESPMVKVAPSVFVLAVVLPFPGVQLKAPPEDTPDWAATDRPRDWVPVWQFERRAAAPAHAPDSLSV